MDVTTATGFDDFVRRHRFAEWAFFERLTEDWPEDVLRAQHHPTMNPLLWIVWHVARIEDVGVNRFVLGRDQLLHADGWADRLGVDEPEWGFTMTTEDAVAMSAALDLEAVLAYRSAVGEHVLGSLGSLTAERLAELLTRSEIADVLTLDGVMGAEGVDEVGEIYSAFDRREALWHFSTTHYYWHGGEIRTIEGLLHG